jgi:hypothetical protein
LRLPEPERAHALAAGAQTTFKYFNGDSLDLAQIGEE